MMRAIFPLLVTVFTLSQRGIAWSAYPDELISDSVAAQHGLTRAWFTQVQLDPSRGRVTHLVLAGKTFFVQTDQAVLHAMDAETGQTLWAVQVGGRQHPSLAPAANDAMVAVVNGSILYVLDRRTGKLAWQTQLEGAPGVGPALSDQRVYVPLVRGKVLSYRLTPVKLHAPAMAAALPSTPATTDAGAPAAAAGAAPAAMPVATQTPGPAEPAALVLEQNLTPPLACQSTGRTLVQPLVTRQTAGEEFVTWSTDAGYLYVCSINRSEEDRFFIRYRLETLGGIAASPAYLYGNPKTPGSGGMIFVPGEDGFVYALRESDGQTLWRFPTGEPMIEPVAAVDNRLYVTTQLGGMYCLPAATGPVAGTVQPLWWTREVTRFIAVSKERVYASDKVGRIHVISAATGVRLDTIPAVALPLKLMNTSNDRIYLASPSGLVQCLHEIDLAQPLVHNPPPPPGILAAEPGAADAPAFAGPASPAAPAEPALPAAEPPAATPPRAAIPPVAAPGGDPFGAPPAGAAPAAPPTAPGADPFGADPFGGAAPGAGAPGAGAPGASPF